MASFATRATILETREFGYITAISTTKVSSAIDFRFAVLEFDLIGREWSRLKLTNMLGPNTIYRPGIHKTPDFLRGTVLNDNPFIVAPSANQSQLFGEGRQGSTD